jgi:hypothetical protein
MIHFKKLAIAGALICFTSAANAALWCKNSDGEEYKWRIGDPRPVNSANFKTDIGSPPVFKTDETTNVVCLVNAELYRQLRDNVIGIRGFPVQASIPNDPASMTGGEGAGVVYRGDMARWLIDNLPSSYGQYANKAYYDSIVP